MNDRPSLTNRADASNEPQGAKGQDIGSAPRAINSGACASKCEWEDFFHAVGHPAMILDPDFRIIAANRATTSAFERPESELLGKRCFELFHQGTQPPAECPMRKLLDSGRWEVAEMEVQALNSTFLVTCTPVLDEQGGLKRVIHFAVDISEKKKMEEQNRRLEHKIRQIQHLESLGVLAGGIAHDFNNHLMGIMGYAGLAMENFPEDSPLRNDLREIEQIAVHASDLCKQMLAYAGKGRFFVGPVNLSDTVQSMQSLLRTTLAKNTELVLKLGASLPRIEGDEKQMRQIVLNLVTNAAEAIGDKRGLVTITTGTQHCDAECLAQTELPDDLLAGDYVFLEVADNGCGMAAEVKSHIFDPFFSTKFTGRGLGLPAVLGIVRSHQGTLRVDSKPGIGTLLRVLFPAATPKENSWKTSTVIPGEKPMVLLVDDEAHVRMVASQMLQRLGFKILMAEDGLAALSLLQEHRMKVTCVLLDLTMPRMDGAETFRELRKTYPDLPVILSSGYTEQVFQNRFPQERPEVFLKKPYTIQSLKETLAKVLKPEPTN